MSVPSTINIDGTEYVRADSVTEAPGPKPKTLIVVIEGRWNIVGQVTEAEDGSLVITKAYVIRYWGTTEGLGELAAGGPTLKTKLDAAGTVRVPIQSVILTLDTKAELWPTS